LDAVVAVATGVAGACVGVAVAARAGRVVEEEPAADVV
jgi:hypothetical protein